MGGVLHVVPQLSGGGAGRATLTAAAAAAKSTSMPQAIASLRPAAPALALRARRAQVELIDCPSRQEVHQAIEGADLVHVHFWNTPELIELLESELPPCRLLVWPEVVGHTPPQVIDRTLIERATMMIATSRRNAETIARIGGEAAHDVIPPIPGWDRVEGVTRSSSAGFNIGYIGTVSLMRLHPDFVRISAAARIPEARFIVCGDGEALRSLPRQASDLGAAERFDFQGFVERIADALTDFDVFGYPIRSGTSASSDLNLKEAMYAGVPPVVLADGSTNELVDHGETGLIAATPEEYPRALERLHANPGERDRLSANARVYAAERWSLSAVGPMWDECYEQALSHPRCAGRALEPPDPELSPGVARFLRGLGQHAGDFEVSLRGSAEELVQAELRIQSCPMAVIYQDGGLLDYRRRHPDDSTLALWTGLALMGAGRRVLATAEFHRARELGFDPDRISKHIGEAAAA